MNKECYYWLYLQPNINTSHTEEHIPRKKRKKNLFRFRSRSLLLGANQIQEGVIVHYESLPEIPEMLLQNLSNTFSSWCSNKSFKMPFTSSGQVVEWRMLYTQLETRPLQLQIFPQRNLTERRLKQKGWEGWGAEVREVERGTKVKQRKDRLWIPYLPEMLFPFSLFTASLLGYNFRIQPKHTVISRCATLTFGLHRILEV